MEYINYKLSNNIVKLKVQKCYVRVLCCNFITIFRKYSVDMYELRKSTQTFTFLYKSNKCNAKH